MRRLISLVSVSVALLGLGLVLYNATTVDRRAPTVRTVSLSAPTDDSRVAQTLTAIDIEFSEPVRTASVESRFSIEPPVVGAFTWDGSTAIFTPSAELPADTEFEIRIGPGFEDLVGNVDEAGLDGWAFRTVGPPQVLRATPADGGTGVPLDGTLELVFDRLMDTVSVETALSVDPAADIGLTWRGSVVTLDFGNTLRFGTTYTVTLATAATDTGGGNLREPFATRFRTVEGGLRVASLVPADGVAGIGIRSPIAITFDGPIDPATAAGALQITPSVDGDVRVIALPGDGTAGPGEPDTLLFVPNSPFAQHTTYTATLAPTVTRLGDATVVAGGRTWTFTTGSPPPSGQNRIAFLSARGGGRNVWVMNPDGTSQRQVTVELAPVSGFDASGDGSQLAYAAGGIVTVMNIDGGSSRRLTVDDGRHEYGPVFTPSDAEILVARRDAAGGDLGWWLVPLPGSDARERQLLDHGAPPTGSSDLGGDGIGTGGDAPPWIPRIAFDTGRDRALIVMADGGIALVDLAPAPQPTVVVALRQGSAPAWVPGRDAFVLAAADSSGTPAGLYAVNAFGAVTRLPDTDGATGPVAAAPDGSLAVARRAPDGSAFIMVVAPGGSVRTLPATIGGFDGWPAYAPDGGSILVSRSVASQPDRSTGIWILSTSSGDPRQLTTDGAFARWIP